MTNEKPKKTALEHLKEHAARAWQYEDEILRDSVLELAERIEALEAKQEITHDFEISADASDDDWKAVAQDAFLRSALDGQSVIKITAVEPFPSSVALDEHLASESQDEFIIAIGPGGGVAVLAYEADFKSMQKAMRLQEQINGALEQAEREKALLANESRQEPSNVIELDDATFTAMARYIYDNGAHESYRSVSNVKIWNEATDDWDMPDVPLKFGPTTFKRAPKKAAQ